MCIVYLISLYLLQLIILENCFSTVINYWFQSQVTWNYKENRAPDEIAGFLFSFNCVLVVIWVSVFWFSSWWCDICESGISWPQGYKTGVHSLTENKTQWLTAWGHMSASSQSLRFTLSLRLNLRASPYSLVFCLLRYCFNVCVFICILSVYSSWCWKYI